MIFIPDNKMEWVELLVLQGAEYLATDHEEHYFFECK